jgi:hypothetical protein
MRLISVQSCLNTDDDDDDDDDDLEWRYFNVKVIYLGSFKLNVK